MPEKKPEWIKFKVGKPSKENGINTNCQTITEIDHVSHINSALNIVTDRKIRAGLISDKSKLNTERILVTWLSPNDWHGSGGFRYGHIRFTFDWKSIIEDMQAYWVESIAYGIPACRILLTTNDYSSLLQKYDPSIPFGPWWHDKKTDIHYWNGNYCLEIMLESDLNVSEALKIDFVTHHPNYCCIQRNCPDRKISKYKAGSIFISSIVGREISHNLPSFLEEKSDKHVRYIFEESCAKIWTKLKDQEYKGRIISTDDIAKPLSRAILNAYANSNNDDIAKLCSLFKSHKSLIRSCADLICECFQISKWRYIVPEYE